MTIPATCHDGHGERMPVTNVTQACAYVYDHGGARVASAEVDLEATGDPSRRVPPEPTV
jgi:hypothetical protein